MIGFLDTIGSIAQIVTPIILLSLGGLGWYIRQSVERKAKVEEALRGDRLEVYNKILEPFFILLMTDAAWAQDPKTKGKDKTAFATAKMLSWEYRKAGLQLSLIGSDGVVKAYNDLMQFAFAVADTEPQDLDPARNILSFFGNLLLEIRKSAGNESTQIGNMGMVEWFVKDARTFGQ